MGLSGLLLSCWLSGLFGLAAVAGAEAPEPEPLPDGPGAEILSGPWAPPALDADQLDWIVINSGEWLRGNIDYIDDETLYFDSEELDDVEIDWADIIAARCTSRNSFRMTDNTVHTGTMGLRDGVIRILTEEGVREYPQDMLMSMIEGDLRELNYWSFEVGGSLTVRSGNSDEEDLTMRAELKRETPFTRGLVKFDSVLSTVDDEDVTDNRSLKALLDFFLTQRLFVRVPQVDLYQDEIRNLALRATVSAGVGYEIIDWKKVSWEALIGAGYQRTEFEETLPGEDDASDDGAVVFSTIVEFDPFKDVEWDTEYALIAVVTDSDQTAHRLDSVISIEIWGPLDFDLSFRWDRIEEPEVDATGERPDSDDFQVTAGISLEL